MEQKRICIIEDDNQLRTALSEKFSRENFIVLPASDGAEGLKLALAEKPDIFLLDLVMPNVGGWEMLKMLRESGEWGKQVPVIILSNLNSNDDAQMAQVTKLEPSFFLEKATWNIDDVVQKVKERLI